MRRRPTVAAELPRAIAAKDRAFAEEYAARLGVSLSRCGGRLQRAQRIEAGEPVEVYGWEVPAEFAPPEMRASGERFTLRPDGWLSPSP